MFLGTILLDTICLNDKAQRVTTKDKIIIADLENLLGEVDRNVFYQKLLKAKLNISSIFLYSLCFESIVA